MQPSFAGLRPIPCTFVELNGIAILVTKLYRFDLNTNLQPCIPACVGVLTYCREQGM